MAQTQTPRYRQTDSTPLFRDLSSKPGPIQGFIPTVLTGSSLSLGPSTSRLEHTSEIADADIAVKRIQNVLATKQGVYVAQDEPYTLTGYPSGSVGQFRVDALTIRHKYISGLTPQTAVLTVITGVQQSTLAAAQASAPTTDNLPDQTLVGYVTMRGVDLTTASIEILYVDPVAYHEYAKLDSFVGTREIPTSFASAAVEEGKSGTTVTGALYGAERRIEETLTDLLQALDLAMPQGTVAYTADSPSAFFDSTGKGLANTKWARWAICNGQNNTLNLAGRVVVGWDGTANNALDINIADNPDLPEAVRAQLNYARTGNTGGGNTRRMTVDQMPAHNHGGVTGTNNGSLAHNHGLPPRIIQVDDNATGSIQGGTQARFVEVGGTATTTSQSSTLEHTHNITSQGGGQTMDVRQPYIVLTPIMYLGRG